MTQNNPTLSPHLAPIADPATHAQVRNQEQYRAALGSWLAPREWTHFVTLTSSSETPDVLRREFTRYRRNLERVAQRRVTFFYTIESSVAGVRHLHALLGGTAGVSLEDLKRRWTLGFAHVELYAPAERGAYYLQKCVEPGGDGWDIGSHLPCDSRIISADRAEVGSDAHR